MKPLFFLILSIFLVKATSVNAQQYQENRLVMFATDSLMEEIFKEVEVEYEQLDKHIYRIILKGRNVLVNIDGNRLNLYAPFTNKPTLNRINDFNEKYRWVRVYLDDNRELMMADELDFGKGISVKRINIFLNTFGELIDALIEHIK